MRLDLGIAELGERRHLGQERRAFRAADRERLDAPGFERRHRARDAGEGELYFARHHRRHGERNALVRHVHEIDARLVLQHLARKVRLAAAAIGRIVDAAGPVLREADQLRQICCRQRRIRDQELLQQHEHRDWREVALGVVRQLRIQVRVDGERGIGGEEHAVGVRWRFCDRIGGDDGVRAGPVLDHDGLCPGSGQLLRELAAEHVDAAAGWIGDDDANRFRRPGLRRGRGCEREQAGSENSSHRLLC